MNRTLQHVLAAAALTLALGGNAIAATFPDPLVDAPRTAVKGKATAVFAGGCFWGVEAVFKHVKGVTGATSGYSGGAANTAHYEMVGSGATGHAESVQVSYDPSQISYGQLLRVFFSVAHDPTQLNRQGPDVGTQYRSAIFFANAEQRSIAQAYVAQLQSDKLFSRPIVTELAALQAFYPAEAYHQDYLARHPSDMYIVINDQPKLAQLKQQLPDLYAAR